ncbi:MAG: TlpA family protein disulfide reductase [Muribaculaceae bacterium]|nr:TlpA family protein disulfide reductase [Muribaculaceae bacterium]
MRRFSLACALAAGMVVNAYAGSRIVEYPLISYSNTGILDIERVELTDTATIVRFDARYSPKHWIKLGKDVVLRADGKTYALRSAHDVTPGEKLWMPESGQATFTLIFEPLPLSTEKFDFSEGDSENDWTLADILLSYDALSPRPLPAGLPENILKDFVDGPLPLPSLTIGESTVNVHFLGDRPEFASKLSIIIDEAISGQKGAEMIFDQDGNAVVKFTQYGPASIQILDREYYIPYADFHIIPGETVDCYLDGTISGYKTKLGRDAAGIPRDRFVMHNGKLSNFDRMISQIDLDKDYLSWLENGEKKLYRLDRESYMKELKSGYSASLDSITNANLPEMEKEIQKIALQDMILEAVAHHKDLMRYQYLSTTGRWDEEFSYDSIPATLTDEDFKEVTTWFDVSDPRLLLHGSNSGLAMTDWNAYGVKGDLSKSLYKLSEILKKANNAVLTKEDVDEMRLLSNPFFAQVADSLYVEMNRKIAKLDSTVKPETIPDVPLEQLFDAIVAPYKGKVVVVDLWNTWCGPCRRAIKQIEPLKDGELSDEDIVWIYIADESSDHFQYLEMIPNIKGVHYKLNREQIEEISERFKVDGIPYYILIDRAGNAKGRPDIRDHSKYVKEIKALL